MTTTPKLGLTFLEEGQNQAEITHNDALVIIDSIACLTVKDRDLSSPPGGPALGDAYFVASVGSGLWAGHTNDIAIFNGNNWVFVILRTGWSLWVDDEAASFIWNGATLEDPLSTLNIPISTGSEIGLHILLGHVNAAGGIVRGSGFSLTHVGASAEYFYTYAVAFGTIPILVPSIFGTKFTAQAGTSSQGTSTTAGQIDTLFFALGGIDTPHAFYVLG